MKSNLVTVSKVSVKGMLPVLYLEGPSGTGAARAIGFFVDPENQLLVSNLHCTTADKASFIRF